MVAQRGWSALTPQGLPIYRPVFEATGRLHGGILRTTLSFVLHPRDAKT
jgi:hypothetical protein